ncbi:MAG: peptidylprolyl isomerase [Oscillospiraceae bacterium]|nr:peptidylprolyl isomerase [Oscillospiraceae bacterium]
MKKCKKCGRPLGNNLYCSVCDRDKLRAAKQKQQKKQETKSQLPWILGIIAAVCLVVAAVVTVIVVVKSNTSADVPETDIVTEDADAPTDVGIHHCEIEIENYGTITVELDGDAAPITVENFIKLANEGFYDGLTFHRIIEGFMMQGGASSTKSAATIKGEFSANGVDNPLLHTRGAISMARSDDMNSANSQFFIVHQTSPHLDGKYACFGYVTDGMDVVDAVCESAQPVDNNGTIPAEQQPVITTIRVID